MKMRSMPPSELGRGSDIHIKRIKIRGLVDHANISSFSSNVFPQAHLASVTMPARRSGLVVGRGSMVSDFP